MTRFCPGIVAMVAALCCSCQQYVMTPNRERGNVGSRTYSDAVVHIGQVDPAYRPYFQSQNGANYSLSEQRKAFLAAAQTARTPVRETDYRPAPVRSKSTAKNRSRNTRMATTGKGKTTAKTRTAAVVKKPARRR